MFYHLRLIYSNLLRTSILNMENCQRLRIENKANEAENIISLLKYEIKDLELLASKNQASSKIKSIKEENEALSKEINIVKKELINIQLINGTKQVPLPGDDNKAHINTCQAPMEEIVNEAKIEIKKQEECVPHPKPAPKDPAEPPVDIGRLDLRVGYIVEVNKHPDADSLYVEQIDVGEEASRTIISGLVNYVPLEDLKNRSVVVLCNLKPMKMRGILSQGMVMCASAPQAVEPLIPPTDSIPGDVIIVDGYIRNPDTVLNPKKKIFETIAPDLKTNSEGIATYKGVAWKVSGREGFVRAKSLIDAAIK